MRPLTPADTKAPGQASPGASQFVRVTSHPLLHPIWPALRHLLCPALQPHHLFSLILRPRLGRNNRADEPEEGDKDAKNPAKGMPGPLLLVFRQSNSEAVLPKDGGRTSCAALANPWLWVEPPISGRVPYATPPGCPAF